MPTGDNLCGLVLAGGFSSRLGRDKGLLRWNGYPQRSYLLDVFASLGIPAWLSCRAEQSADIPTDRVLLDEWEAIGPAGGLLSASHRHPHAGWLVVACDMPGIDAAVLEYLVRHRSRHSAITSLVKTGSDRPEPLLAIWEPEALRTLEHGVARGDYRLLQVFEQVDVTLIPAPWPEKLENINTPAEMRIWAGQKGIDWRNL